MENHVISLIDKMTKREKFYFAKLYDSSKTKNFFKIYTYITENSPCTIKDIKTKFKDTSIERNLSSELALLYKRILRSLNIYNINLENDSFNLFQSLQNVSLLIDKGESKQARKILMKAKSKAIENEQFSTLVNILTLQESLDIMTTTHSLVKQSQGLAELRQECIYQIQTFFEYKKLRNEFIDLQFKFNPLLNDHKEFIHIFENPILLEKPKLISKRSYEMYLICNELKYYILGKFELSLQYSKERVEYLLKYPNLFFNLDLGKALNNYTLLLLNIRNYEEAAIYIEKVKDLMQIKNAEKYIPFIINYLSIKLYTSSRDKEKLEPYLKNSLNELLKRLGSINKTQANEWLKYIMVGYMHLSDYDQSLMIYNLWAQHGFLEYSFLNSKLLRCISLLETKSYNLLDSELNNLYKKYYNSENPKPIFRYFYSYFNNTIKTPHKELEHLLLLKSKIHKIMKDNLVQRHLDEIDILYWIEKREKSLLKNK